MKTKIGLPLGLALVMFIGIFTAMLALGVMAPQPASAAITAEFVVTLTNDEPEEETGLSFTFTTEKGVAATEAVNVIFATGYTATAAGAWTLNDVPATAAVDGTETQQLNLTPGAAIIAPIDPDTTIQIAVDYTPPGDDSGIKNPALPEDLTVVADSTYSISVKTTQDSTAVDSAEFTVVGRTTLAARAASAEAARLAALAAMPVSDVKVSNSPNDPGASTAFTITFETASSLQQGLDEITFEFHKEIGIPTSISPSSVTVSADGIDGDVDDEGDSVARPNQSVKLTEDPGYATVSSGEGAATYTIEVPNMDDHPDHGPAGIAEGATVTVKFGQGAGFTNPTEATFPYTGSGQHWVKVSTSVNDTQVTGKFGVPLTLVVDDIKDGRGKPLTVTGKGYKGGTSATLWLDNNQNGVRDNDETDLISVPVSADDTFEVTITQSVPPFVTGNGNWINVVDGENSRFGAFAFADTTSDGKVDVRLAVAYDDAGDLMWPAVGATVSTVIGDGIVIETHDLTEFLRQITIANTVTLSPATAGVGDTVQIDLKDWPKTDVVNAAQVAGISISVSNAVIDDNGQANFEVEIPDNVPVGTHKLYVRVGTTTESANITIGGASLVVTPTSVVPNQSMSVIGRGFKGGAYINRDANDVPIGTVSIGNGNVGEENINDNESIRVDNGGNWSTTIIVPVTSRTASGGSQRLKVVDSAGREGSLDLDIATRTLTIDPAVSRVGTNVTLTGTGFPATNTNSRNSAPSVRISYDSRQVTSVTPDSSGSFMITFQVPLNRPSPSTNIVEARFEADGPVLTTTIHNVPTGDISLSVAEGVAGTEVTLSASGFKAYTSLQSLNMGGTDIMPDRRPNTGFAGNFETTFIVPQLGRGTHTVEANVGGTVSSAPFNILDDEAPPVRMDPVGAAAAPADAFAEVIAEDNLITVYHFDPATQSEAPNRGWTLYDARPLFMGGNNLDMVNPGGFYFVEVSENQMGVTLGGRTMDLYAGLNPIVW